jgi:PPOX class probable F420-dependent enzyme
MTTAPTIATIPESHRDLLERPLTAALTTRLPDGRLQTHPVWFDAGDGRVRVNTMRGFRKERNMRADPRVTLLVVDPGPNVHWIEVRGLVDLGEEAAGRHLDGLAGRYTGVRHYFGGVVPAELSATEVPVMGRISPIRVVTDVDAAAAVARTTVADPEGRPPPRTADAPGPSVRIPATHRDLLRRPLRAALGTLLPGGHPQTQPVWFELDGGDVLVHTTRESRKGRNLLADPRATILVVDPEDAGRWIEIRGDVAISTREALDRLDRITRSYTGHPRYYGSVRPASRSDLETRIVCRIRPRRVVCDAIHR